MKRSTGSVLVGLLWCLALLSVVVIGVLHTARMDLLVVKNYGDEIQAHYLAVAGIEKAKALIYREALERKRSARNHSGQLFDAPQEFRDISLGRGQFRVFRQGGRDEGGKIIYGISDEESRINLNQAAPENLTNLYGLTPEIAAAILDWRDADSNVTPGGAEAEYYSGLKPPYIPRNGPFETTRELLMVAGVTPELFMGEDVNQNGLLDPEEDDGNKSSPPDNHDGTLDAGWSGIVTVDSSVRNRNAAGEERVNVQDADEKSLAAVRGISSDLAKAIVAYRDQNKIQSLADLLEVTAVNPQNPKQQPGANPGQPGSPDPQNNPGQPIPANAQPAGPKLINEDLLMEIGDDISTDSGEEQRGPININTASTAVLTCLPGVTEELAQAIVSYRKSAGFFPNIAWLLRVDGMTHDIFKQTAPKVTARSETFRILSEGRVGSSGARKRIQAIVHLRSSEVETVSYREDL